MTREHSPVTGAVPLAGLEDRLERGEIIIFPVCPFALPEGPDRQFLFDQGLGGPGHKNISYNPHTGRAHGFRYQSADQAQRLRQLLAAFSSSAARWLDDALPRYRGRCRPDRASFRPEEEAVRRLRWKARNDLIHIDAFPTRPTHGDRILRLFVNLNPTDPRVWVTSESFASLLSFHGAALGLPGNPASWVNRWRQGVFGWLQGQQVGRSGYDIFMLRFHHYLKANDQFQERCRKRYWSFAPGSAWLLYTDGLSHADLRGQYALDHSFFVPRDVLVRPDLAPVALLENLSRCQAA